MDGRRTCLVVGLVVAGVAAGGTVASAVPDKDPGADNGNHFGQLKHQPTATETTPTETTPPGPAIVAPPGPPAPATTAETVPPPPPPATETAPSTSAPAVPVVIAGPIDKKLALPALPKSGDIPAVPPGSSDVTSQVVITSGNGPRLLRFIAPTAPMTGVPTSFTLAAADDRPVGGVTFDFDEPAARFGELACRTGAAAHQATFSVPFTFSVPGTHTIRFSVSTGSCGGPTQTTTGEVTVDVGKSGAALRAVTGPDRGVLTRSCPGADLLPSRENSAKTRAATLCLLNQIRKIAGLRKLKNRSSLRLIAAQHAGDMVTRKFFDHTAPPVPASTFAQRLKRIKWKGSAGENLGFGTAYYATPRAAAWAWMHSASHRANILTRGYRWIGIAIANGSPKGGDQQAATYATDFGGR